MKKGDALMEYENEKNTIECDALADGYVHILAQEGDTVPVGEPIGILAESPGGAGLPVGGAAAAPAAAPAAPAPAAAPAEGVVEIPMPRAGLDHGGGHHRPVEGPPRAPRLPRATW